MAVTANNDNVFIGIEFVNIDVITVRLVNIRDCQG